MSGLDDALRRPTDEPVAEFVGIDQIAAPCGARLSARETENAAVT
jgi:hypothetical protein